MIFEVLRNIFKHNKSVTTLILGHRFLEIRSYRLTELKNFLLENKTIRNIFFRNSITSAKEHFMEAIEEIMIYNENIESLELSLCNILNGIKVANNNLIRVCNIISQSKNLKYLHLFEYIEETDYLEMLSDSIRKSNTLERLYIYLKRSSY